MKKIIKPGHIELKTKPIYKETCACCGCVFEFDDEEVTKRTKTFSTSNFNFLHNAIYVNCPCCDKELEIYNPTIIREELVEMEGDNNGGTK